jgi:hypothetical protein
MVMLRGRAIGGPRNGTVLDASSNWIGTLRDNFTGRYVWDAVLNTWKWEKNVPSTRTWSHKRT